MSDALKTPVEMFYQWEKQCPDEVFLRQSTDGGWREYTWSEVGTRVRSVGEFIRQQALPPGSHIAILSANSADWFIADLAIMLTGNVSIPLYPGQDVDSGQYIIEHSEARLIFLGAFDQAARADDMLGTDIPRIAMRGCAVECDHDLEKIVEDYAPFSESPVPDLDATMTILYTSGTTGNPKGVVHPHGTPARVIPRHLNAIITPEDIPRDRLFSFLPLSHAAERVVVEMRALYDNASVSFSAGLESFSREMAQVRPTLFFAVPRLWVKFKEAIDAKFPPEIQASFGEEQKRQVREALGLDQTRVALTGSAPTPVDVHQWFLDMGVSLQEGYSMTENFIDGCFNLTAENCDPGVAGPPMPGVDVKLTDEGEICFRSDGLMKEYYREPEKTAQVLRDGWYHTGDSGKILDDGRVVVTGRLGEVFKSSKGKFINPNRIESAYAGVEDLGQLCAFGHGAVQPMMFVTLSEAGMKKDAEAVTASLASAMETVNQDLPSYERVAHIFVTPQEWTIDNGMLTPTMKIKRRALVDCFSEDVAAQSGGQAVVWL